jgi:hypothetical protein
MEGESYWEQTPWKGIPAEEFNSYRWQVGEIFHSALHSLQTTLDLGRWPMY